ncbi:MAG: tRNA-dihydrouridine synthase [Vicinamibacterales bacterium]
MDRLRTRVGTVALKNPLIAAPAEHFIDPAGVRAAIAAGAGAVVVKSTNESEAARDQLRRAEYAVLDAHWRPVPWDSTAPRDVTIACRSGLSPLGFDDWLTALIELDRVARQHDCLVVASLVVADLGAAVEMARRVGASTVRALELNVGTPYGNVAAKGAVSTELEPARVREIVAAVRAAVALPVWVKVTGQSERVPALADAAFAAGADAVVMAGRLLGFLPDLDTQAPLLGTSLGVGGYWNLPLTCQWLAATRAAVGPDRALIGINGAQDGEDIARLMLAGASAVGMASAIMLRGYDVIPSSLAQLDDYLAAKGMCAQDLVGRAADRRQSFAALPIRPDPWRPFVPPWPADRPQPTAPTKEHP